MRAISGYLRPTRPVISGFWPRGLPSRQMVTQLEAAPCGDVLATPPHRDSIGANGVVRLRKTANESHSNFGGGLLRNHFSSILSLCYSRSGISFCLYGEFSTNRLLNKTETNSKAWSFPIIRNRHITLISKAEMGCGNTQCEN